MPLAVEDIFRSRSNLLRAELDLDGASPSLLIGKIKSRMMLILVTEHHCDDALVQMCLLVKLNSPPTCPYLYLFPCLPCMLVVPTSKTSHHAFSGKNKHVIVPNLEQPKQS